MQGAGPERLSDLLLLLGPIGNTRIPSFHGVVDLIAPNDILGAVAAHTILLDPRVDLIDQQTAFAAGTMQEHSLERNSNDVSASRISEKQLSGT